MSPLSPEALFEERRLVLCVEAGASYRRYIETFTEMRKIDYSFFEYVSRRDDEQLMKLLRRLDNNKPSLLHIKAFANASFRSAGKLAELLATARKSLTILIDIELPEQKNVYQLADVSKSDFEHYTWLKLSSKEEKKKSSRMLEEEDTQETQSFPNVEPVDNLSNSTAEYNQTNSPNVEPVGNLSNDPTGANASNPFANFTIDLPFVLRKYERPERLIDSLHDPNVDKSTPPVSPASLLDAYRVLMFAEKDSKYVEYMQAFALTRNVQFISTAFVGTKSNLELLLQQTDPAKPAVLFISADQNLWGAEIHNLSTIVAKAHPQLAIIIGVDLPVNKTIAKHYRDEKIFQSYTWLKVSKKETAFVDLSTPNVGPVDNLSNNTVEYNQTNSPNVGNLSNSIYDDPFSIRTLLKNAAQSQSAKDFAEQKNFWLADPARLLSDFLDLPGERQKPRPARKKAATANPKSEQPFPFGDYLVDFRNKDLSLELYLKQIDSMDTRKASTFKLLKSFCDELNAAIRGLALRFPQILQGRQLADNYFSSEEWTIYLLSSKEEKDEQISHDREFDQVLNFLLEPALHVMLWNDQQRRQVCFNLLKRPYNKNYFDDLCLAWFDEQNIECANRDNYGILISALLLDPSVAPQWQVQNLPKQKETTLSGVYSADVCTEDIEDKLDITPDVEALAALIAYKDLSLPMAIGLFGHWGSGKSFFMSKLRKRIRDFQRDAGEDPSYCGQIVHVEFNAWHYSDANLWANLMVNIFEHLQEHIDPKNKEDAKKLLMQELESTREAVNAANKEVEDANKEIEAQQQELDDLKIENDKKAQELATVTPRDIYGALSSDEKAVIENRLGAIAKELKLGKAQTSVHQLQELISEFSKLRGRFNHLIDLFVNSSPAKKALWIFLLLSPVAVIVFFRFTQDLDWLKGMKGYISSFIAFAGGVVAWAAPQLKKLNKKLDEVEDVRKRVDALVEAKRQELRKEEAKLEQELDELARQRAAAETKLHEAEQRKLAAEKALDDQNIQKQLSSFIQARGSSDDYKKHLGLISIIRKDLGKLSELLKASRKEDAEEENGEKKTGSLSASTIAEARKVLPKVERIVLYIDDLDRCQGDRVVHVLEALHLLLALDLFVVIVGVDARWVSKALADTNRVRTEDETDQERALDVAKSLPGQATAFDYLEKIFQIPLVLKPMNKQGTKDLLSSLFEIEPPAEDEMESKALPPTEEEPQTKNEPQQEPHDGMKEMPQEKKQEQEQKQSADPAEEKTFTQEKTPAKEETSTEQKQESNVGSSEAVSNTGEKEERKIPEPAPAHKLRISADEMSFMHALSPVIGGTPRTVKRFANLYRLLRVHDATPNYSYESHEDFKAIMVLLAIVTGNGPIANLLLEQLEITDRTELAVFAKELRVDESHPYRQQLYRVMREFQELEPVEIVKMKEHLPFVRRFSFRTLDV